MKTSWLSTTTRAGRTRTIFPARGHSDTYTQEFDLNTDTFGGRLKSIYGMFYFNDYYVQQTNVISSLFGGSHVDVYQANMYQKAKSLAFFTDHTFSVTDRFRLLAGIRFNHDHKTAVQTIRNQCTNVLRDLTFEAWTPRAGVQYDISDQIKTYATYQKGFKSGGIGSGTCGDTFRPETIEGGEAGVKTSLANNRVHLNFSGYWYDYKNLQRQKTLGTAGGFAVQNAAAARIKGLEASFDAAITDQLKLDGAAMVQTAKYTDYVNCNPADSLGSCTAGHPSRLQDLTGNWLDRAPPYSVSLGAQYSIPVAGGELVLRAESYWSGTVRFTEFAGPVLTQKDYDIQNAYVTFTTGNNKYVVRAFIKNITDTNYRVGGAFDGFTLIKQAIWGPSRTFGGEVTARF